MKKLLFLLLFLESLNLYAQHTNPQLYIKSVDISNNTEGKNRKIKKIKRADWSDKIIVYYSNGNKKTFSSDSLWGFRDNDGNIFRSFKGELYNLRQQDSLCIYSMDHNTGKVNYTNYYFSKSLDSNIFSLDKTDIKEQLNNSSCILEKIKKEKELFEVDYSAYDKANKTYKIVEFYKACNL